MLAQPWVDALGVVKVKVHGQQLHHLPELEGAELHRARRHFLAGGVHHFSLQRKVADTAGEEAAACAVCLGAFEFGEMVRLLPVCLHLYHAECIDPWVRKHSTCPVCRSETDPTVVMDVSQLPPV